MVVGPWTDEGEESREAAAAVLNPVSKVYGVRWGVMRLFRMVGKAPLVPRVSRRTHRFDAVRAFRDAGGLDIETAMQHIRGFNGTYQRGAVILFGPGVPPLPGEAEPPTPADAQAQAIRGFALPGAVNGAPYLQFFKYANEYNGSRFHEDVLEAIVSVLGNVPLRFRLRVDLLYMAVDAAGNPFVDVHPPTYMRRQAYIDELIVDMPFRFPQPAVSRMSTQNSLQIQLRRYIDRFLQFTQNPPDMNGSSKTLQSVVACMVYVVESNAAGPANLDLYGGKVPFRRPAPLENDPTYIEGEGFSLVPGYIHKSLGVTPNSDRIKDSRCFARALMVATDKLNESHFETSLVVLLRFAEVGAVARLNHVRRLPPVTNAATIASRQRMEQEATANLESVRADCVRAEKMFTEWGRHIRDRDPKVHAERYKQRNREAEIERSLQSAFRGDHALFDLREEFFKNAVPLDSETLTKVRAATRLLPSGEPAVIVQVWTLTPDGKVGLTFRTDKPTLDYLWKGGRVVNLLFGHNHVSVLSNITSVNHSNPTGGFKDRVYCPLCGDCRSENKGTEKWGLHEHRVAGCRETPGMRMLPRNALGGKHWLGRANLKARNLPSHVVCIGGTITSKDTGEFETNEFEVTHAIPTPNGWYVTETSKSYDILVALDVAARSMCLLSEKAFGAKHFYDLHLPALQPAGICDICRYPLDGLSAHQFLSEASCKAAAVEDSDLEADSTEDEFKEPPVALVSDSVPHRCPYTYFTMRAHADCHEDAHFHPFFNYIEVASPEIMAVLVDTLFLRSTIEDFLANKMPTLSEHEGVIRRVTFEYGDKTYVLRPRTAFFSTLQSSSYEHLAEFVQFCSDQRGVHGLWPGFFGTVITYSRVMLFDMAQSALPLGTTPTSLCDRDMVEMLKSRMLSGGRLIMGEQAVLEPGDDETLCMLDVTACYPHILQTHALPCDEGGTALYEDFSGRVVDALAFVAELDAQEGEYCYFMEVSGFTPDSEHGHRRGLPPVYSKRRVTGKDLSVFQRTTLNIDIQKTMAEANVGHFFPLENALMFAVELKTLIRNGFSVTEVGRVWRCTASRWGKPFADALEKARRGYEEKGDKARSTATKLVANSVIGALGVNPQNYCSMRTKKGWSVDGELSLKEYMRSTSDQPEFTLRTPVAGDCMLFEFTKRSWKHTGSTLAYLFVHSVARAQLQDIWYGTDTQKGIYPALCLPIMGYGATDSMSFMFKNTLQNVLSVYAPLECADVRHILWNMFRDKWDLSNVPEDSSFLRAEGCGVRCRFLLESWRFKNRAKWGCWKEVTGFAGIRKMVINGPNRYGYVARDDTTVLKGLPLTLQDGRFSLDDFSASLDGRDPVVLTDPLPLRARVDRQDMGSTVQGTRMRKFLSLWRNTAVVVAPDWPCRHYPLGSRDPAALDLLSTAAWRALEAQKALEGGGGVPESKEAEEEDIEAVVLPMEDSRMTGKRTRDQGAITFAIKKS